MLSGLLNSSAQPVFDTKNQQIIDNIQYRGDISRQVEAYLTYSDNILTVIGYVGTLKEVIAEKVNHECAYRYLLVKNGEDTAKMIFGIAEVENDGQNVDWLIIKANIYNANVDLEQAIDTYIPIRLAFATYIGQFIDELIEEINRFCGQS